MLTSSAVNTGFSKPYCICFDSVKSALFGRFFVCLWLFTGVPAGLQAKTDSLHDPACRTADYDAEVEVKKIIDGDTIILSDNRHVRLVGINTPEIGRDGNVSEPGAEEARNFLERLLHTNNRLKLHYDKEKHDRYNRTLAHLFLANGLNIQALLLSRGLATTLTIPPNLDFLDCYRSSVADARLHHIGLWAMRNYQPLPATQVSSKSLGYRIITGEVTRTGESRSTFWINLGRNVALRITHEDMAYFDPQVLQGLVGKTVLAQGWLYLGNGEYRMQIRHPADLHISSLN